MKIFIEKFNVRWADLDANRHVGNSSYMNYCSQTRMSFFNSKGLGISQMIRWNIGPVLLKEEFTFYREIYANETIYVSLEVVSISEDGSIYQLKHKIYGSNGIHRATSIVTGVWIDMIKRKRTTPPNEIKEAILSVANQNDIKLITMEDIKGKEKPSDMDPEFLSNNYYKY